MSDFRVACRERFGLEFSLGITSLSSGTNCRVDVVLSDRRGHGDEGSTRSDGGGVNGENDVIRLYCARNATGRLHEQRSWEDIVCAEEIF